MDLPVGRAVALGKHHERLPTLKQAHGLAGGAGVAGLDVDREGAEEPDQATEHGDVEEPAPRHVIDRPAYGDGDQRRVGVRLMVGDDDEAPLAGDVLGAAQLEAEIGAADGVNRGTEDVDDRGPRRHVP